MSSRAMSCLLAAAICVAAGGRPSGGETVKVAAVQFISKLAAPAENRKGLERRVREAARNGAKIVVLPETAVTGYMSTDLKTTWLLKGWRTTAGLAGISPRNSAETVPGESTRAFGKLAAELGIYLTVPLLEVDPKTGRYFNTVVLVDPRGQMLLHYRKLNPWPFAERSWATKGDRGHQYVDTPYGRLALLICFDINFEPQRLKKHKIDTLLYPIAWVDEAGSKWFDKNLPDIARDNDMNIVGANWTVPGKVDWHGHGESRIIARTGKILAKPKKKIGETILYAELPIPARPADVKVNACVTGPLLELGDRTRPQLAWNAKSLAEHRAWKRKTAAKIRELVGTMPAEVPLQVRWAEKTETDRLTRHKIYVRSEENYWVPAYYFVPKGIRRRTPAIVCLHGHSGVMPYIREGTAKEKQKSKEHSLDYAVYLAEHGYVTIAAVVRGWNETRHIRQKTPHSCHRLSLSLFLVGRTPVGLRCWDASRLIDFLETRDVVDPAKIGVAGLSGGGMLATFLPALDDRVALAMIGGYFCTFRDSIYRIDHCICNCVPHIMEWCEMSDVVASYAPKPVLIISGTKDPIFFIAATRKAYKKLREVYGVLGAADQVDSDFFDGPHAWSHRKTLGFLHEHFGPPPAKAGR